MLPELWQKINDIFNDAADLPAGERAGFLDAACETPEIRRAVEKLLAAEDAAAGEFLETPALEFAAPPMPDRIGKYEVVRELGRGGMGTVYLAERRELGQKVALKIIKKGLDSDDLLRRFESERKILAQLEHPNIARLVDGGATADGLPFYVMEYIEGVAIDEYCREKPLEERLQLFRQVCKAVAFAHARLVVHRDLKPSNILVDAEGTVKLLDFGIAKLLTAGAPGGKGTATALGMMTPNYASPEQIRGEPVTTATDIYSLGIVLYELLTGTRPYDLEGRTLDKVFEIINETEPVKPSENPKSEIRNPKLKGDLDNIVLRALKKEPARRYQSVAEFSEDIRRYQTGLPVTARPDTFRYRAAKFVRRNRIAVAAAAVVFLSLIAGISVASWQAVVARRERALAERRFADVRNLANKVVFRYHDEIARFPGATALREELVGDAVQYLDSLNSDEIDDKQLKLELARAYVKIGDVQGRPYTANLGKSDDALRSYHKSIEILEKASAKAPRDYEIRQELVHSLARLVPLEARLSISPKNDIERALGLQLEINQSDLSNPARNAAELADVYVLQADHSEVGWADKIEIFRKALALLEGIAEKTSEIQHNITRVNQRLGTNYVWFGDEYAKNGDPEKARECYRAALPFHEKMFESTEAEIAMNGLSQNLRRLEAGAYVNLGETYLKLDRRDKVLEMLRKNLEICDELARADEKNTEALFDVSNAYQSFAEAYEKFGELPKALDAARNSLGRLEKAAAVDPRNSEAARGIVGTLGRIAGLLEKMNRPAEARAVRGRTAELCRDPNYAAVCRP
ncbi:MAG: serine/threonine protein kinase [Acidobacteria bacterium]|nr:serine/threonine protein kinase [Acidobacteriota bacterium]